MTSKERVISTIKFKGPDRIPVDLWPVPASFKRHGKNLEKLFEKHPIDFVHPNWVTKWEPETMEPIFKLGRYTDEWGVVRESKEEGYGGIDIGHPLKDWNNLKTFKPPVHEWIFTASHEDPFRDPDKFYLGVGSIFFHRMCFLRGMENLLIDLMDGVPEVYQLRDMLMEYYTQQVAHLAKTEVDGIIFLDDWGSQRQLLIPPKLWRSFFKPVYRELFAICKKAGKFIFFHSDGYILEIIEDFIELGVDALNSQVWCMGPEVLGERFRGRITFWGEINRQVTIPNGSPDDIRSAAAEMKKYLAAPEGGLIGQGEIDGLTPLENVEALLTAWNQSF
ncbi:MAG: hypothetical protein HY663_02905 [Chloroflexi bacterium]|nr:hypothetical protein [Chloroflexota bacterium]